MRYQGKIVLISGTSRGLGYVIAEHFLENGATVIGLSRNEHRFESPNYHHVIVDIGDPQLVVDTFKRIAKTFSRIDIVVNNAAVLTSQYSLIMPIKNAVDMINVNFLGTFFVSRESAKLMRKSGHGRIINIGSMAASLEPMGDSIYAATKVGIQTLANVMAKEFASMNITCNTIGITAFDSDMLRSHTQKAQEKINNIIKNLAVPRKAEAADVLNVIDFFASEKSSYITSQTIYLGGVN
jgi:3-oxoacyl-[acyl-carrier protein] reductase